MEPAVLTELIGTIWQAMAAMFGARWTRDMGSDHARDLWAKALADIPPEATLAALDQVSRAGDDWPPSLPKFREMARACRRRIPAERRLEKRKTGPGPIYAEEARKIAAMGIKLRGAES